MERDRDGEKWLVETSEKMTPLQESIDQFLSKGMSDMRLPGSLSIRCRVL